MKLLAVHPSGLMYTRVFLRLEPLGLELASTAWSWGRRTGHVGGADQLTGLAELVETGAAGPGDRVMLVGIGAGFSWTCAVVEVLTPPSWIG